MKNKKGFTLVEIMVSAVILALVASGIFSVMLSQRYVASRSKQRLQALELARLVIEKGRIYIDPFYWDVLTMGSWGNWDTATPPYKWRTRIDPGPVNTTYKKVTVEVWWNETAF